MPFAYRLEDYQRYRQAVGGATIVDVSRRTDPARISQLWTNLDEVLAQAPAPWIVHLWTKSPGGVLELGGATLARARDLGVTLAAQVTITGLAGTLWEPRAPQDAIDRLPELILALGGPQNVTWRYDPIIPTIHDVNRFKVLAWRIADMGIRRGVINFLAVPGRYKRVDRRLANVLPGWSEGMPGYDRIWCAAVAAELVDIGREYGIAVACCAESAALADEVSGMRGAACGDHSWFVALACTDPGRVRYRGSRPGCGCAKSYDVGSYGHWKACHGCLYCYAG